MGPELYVCFSRAAYGDGVSLAGQADTCLALGAFQTAELAWYPFSFTKLYLLSPQGLALPLP